MPEPTREILGPGVAVRSGVLEVDIPQCLQALGLEDTPASRWGN